jgi:molybdopterin molybdotransferase
MPEFLHLLTPADALVRLLDHLPHPVEPELVDTIRASERVTAEPVVAETALPSFPRSTVDGYAVRAIDTYGASDSLPAYLRLLGEVRMGEAPSFGLTPASCALVHTGGMLPRGADAVVMLEHTQPLREAEIEIMRPSGVGENILAVGEDVHPGQVVIGRGVRLRPAEIGGLMALGCTSVKVARKPVVGILSTGDEIVPPDVEPGPGQVRDVNTYSLSALVEQAGGLAVPHGIVVDEEEALFRAAESALAESDTLVITAGSSAGARDLTAAVIQRLGLPGVLVHGINIRPGKPTILGACAQRGGIPKAVIGLPGNPVSALVIGRLFLVPVLERLIGLAPPALSTSVKAILTLNVASQSGREDWLPVRLIQRSERLEAEPIFGKSNLVFTLARADGLLRVPADATGLDAGDWGDVILL